MLVSMNAQQVISTKRHPVLLALKIAKSVALTEIVARAKKDSSTMHQAEAASLTALMVTSSTRTRTSVLSASSPVPCAPVRQSVTASSVRGGMQWTQRVENAGFAVILISR